MIVKTDLWQHQQAALDFAMERDASAIFMDMGTGKTLVALKWIEQNAFKRVLIFCPYRVMRVWADEIDKHVEVEYHKIVPLTEDGIVNRVAILSNNVVDTCLIAIMNYESVGRKNSPMQKYLLANADKFDAIILDESHRIKAPGSKTSWFFKRFGRLIKNKMCLTGTPMPNSKLDIYGQYRFLDPGIFGTNFTNFRATYAVVIDVGFPKIVKWINEDEFNKRVDSIAFRVEADDVLDLPDEINVTRYTQLTPAWQKHYNKLEKDFFLETEDGELIADNVLVKILRLHQIAGGHVQYNIFNKPVASESSKLDLLDEILAGLDAKNVVIFVKYLAEIDAITERTYWPVYELSGRQDQLDEWKADGGILLVQVQTGSEGIDLTKARYAIFYSLGYSLGTYQQAKRRIRRPGSDLSHPVTYIHLVIEDTVDVDIYKSIQEKRDTIDGVLGAMRNRYVD